MLRQPLSMDLIRVARFLQFPILVFLSLAIFITLVESRLELETVYDVLKANGLPIGLLPKGVYDFKIEESGKFQAHLDQACNAKFESQLHYDRSIYGSLSYGRISNLTGIQAQELFLWFPVNSIHVDVPNTGLIYFDVGVVFKQFSLSLFERPPNCVAVMPSDAHILSVYKQKNEMLRHQVSYKEIGSAVFES